MRLLNLQTEQHLSVKLCTIQFSKRLLKKQGLLEQGEINANVPNLSVTSLAIQDTQQTSSQTIDDRIIIRGGYRSRGRRPFYRYTGENDPYDMSIAPLNIFENQVIPIGLHNLSKSFRPNVSTIRVLSLGTKFIPCLLYTSDAADE